MGFGLLIRLNLFFALVISSTSPVMAKSSESKKETDIVCFAAQKKWVCAPKGQQDIAKQKAEKLIESKPDESLNSDVVITTVNQPSFSSSEQYNRPQRPSPMDFFRVERKKDDNAPKDLNDNDTTVEKTTASDPMAEIPEAQRYAKLWSYQLIGVSTKENAIKYVYQMNLSKDDVLVVQTERNNSEWWVVLFKLYKDKQTGQADSINLPENIKSPWLRPLRNLKINGFLQNY